MAMKLQDGTGKGYVAKVNTKNRLQVTAKTEPAAYINAIADGSSYTWSSSFSAATGEEVLYIKNTSKTELLVLSSMYLGAVNTALFSLYEVSGTAAGTAVTGKNTNLSSGNVAAASAYGEASVTGLTIGDRILQLRVPANSSASYDLQDSIILGFNDAVAVTYTGSTGIADVAIIGFYESLEEI